MSKKQTAQKIIGMYQKFGWKLRRVLLTVELQNDLAEIFEKEIVFPSDLNALWFSRMAKNGGETWELRHLSETPYALLEVFEEDEDKEIIEERLYEIQINMKQALTNRGT